MKLNITTQAEFDDALAKGLFLDATSVNLSGLNISVAPKMPSATNLWVENSAALTWPKFHHR